MIRILVAAALAVAAGGSRAQDVERGRALYETHCLECHYERIHKRDPSRSLVKGYPALQAEVARRAELTRVRFALSDLDAIAEYLNRSHYQFPR